MQVLFDHISNGGSLLDISKLWGLSYIKLKRMIYADESLTIQLKDAEVERDTYLKERIIQETSRMSTYNLKDIYNPDGTIKNVTEMPDSLTASIKEVDSDGSLKFHDKSKSLELLGKRLGLFVDRKEISGTITLEQAINRAIEENK